MVNITNGTEEIKALEAKKQELKGHIKVLQSALRDTKIENFNFSKKLTQYKENLYKLKNYCNEMLEPKIKMIERKI